MPHEMPRLTAILTEIQRDENFFTFFIHLIQSLFSLLFFVRQNLGLHINFWRTRDMRSCYLLLVFSSV